MEKSPSERKPNRRFRGRMHFAIREAFGYRQTPVEARDVGYEPIGIGAMDAGQLTIFDEGSPFLPSDLNRVELPPDHWHNWEGGK